MISYIVSYIRNMYYYILYRIRTRNQTDDSLTRLVQASDTSSEEYTR